MKNMIGLLAYGVCFGVLSVPASLREAAIFCVYMLTSLGV